MKRKSFRTSLFIAFSLCLVYIVNQSKIPKPKRKISYKANKLSKGGVGEDTYRLLSENAMLALENGNTLKADEIYIYDKNNQIEAFGEVKITTQDNNTITAKYVTYDPENQITKLRDEVVFQSQDSTLYTDYLDYNLNTKIGTFYNGGRLLQGDNDIKSNLGVYDIKKKRISFKKEVELVNPEYTLFCDRLDYNTVTKIAYFKGKTRIIDKEGGILDTDQGGEYNTRTEKSKFKKSYIETDRYTITAIDISSDKETGDYNLIGNVILTDKETQLTIIGDYANYNQKKSTAEIYGNVLMKKILEDDVLYLTADTLMSIQTPKQERDQKQTKKQKNQAKKKQVNKEQESLQKETGNTEETKKQEEAEPKPDQDRILAYHNVRFYMDKLQGKADQITYYAEDNIMNCPDNPIFWSQKMQITGVTARIFMKEKNIHKITLKENVFIIQQDKLNNFNQIKGRNMTSYFTEGKLDHITVDGNGEAIYFVLEEKEPDHYILNGMNYIQCSDMIIRLNGDKLQKIQFNINPTGVFFPKHLITVENKELPNFKWRILDQPRKKDVLGKHGEDKKDAYPFKFESAD